MKYIMHNFPISIRFGISNKKIEIPKSVLILGIIIYYHYIGGGNDGRKDILMY